MAGKFSRNRVIAPLVLLVGGGLAYGIFVGKPEVEPQEPPPSPPPRIDVMVATPQLSELIVETQGTVRPLRAVKLVSRVSGRVERVAPHFAAGGFFTAGEELVKIEDVDYQFAIARAESQVAAARQRVAEEQGRALQAKREWRDLGSDQANTLFLRKPQLASAEAAEDAAEADLAAARLDLERTVVSVPFNGRISEKLVDIGQFVTPGTAIANVYATDAVEVRLPLTGSQVALLDLPLSYDNDGQEDIPDTEVVLTARFANREWEWYGDIVRTDASIDEDSRVVYAVAEVERPFAREEGSDRPPLSPGLFVNAAISGRSLPDVVELPATALRNDGSVVLVDSNQMTRMHPVHLLQRDGRSVWVRGLEAGDRVVVDESRVLAAGIQVAVNTVPDVAEAPRGDR
ncbi:MAG: efflux RND transporter periplasmic adaptor subunit [Pseudomonadota bacterium]